MNRGPQRRIRRLCAARPIGLCRCRPATITAAPIVAVRFDAGFRMLAGRGLSARAEVKAHVMRENFNILKKRNTEGEGSPETRLPIGAFH